MKQFLKWTAIILGVLALAAVAVISVIGLLRFGGMPVTGRGFYAPLRGGYRLFLVPLMLARLIIPLVFLALLFMGGYVIGRASRGPRVQAASGPVNSQVAVPTTTATACPNCEKAVLADWNHCPYCGASLKGGEPPVSISSEGNG